MSLESQAKLLRVLEEKEIRRLGGGCDIKVDVRIISSINTMPQIALQKNQLREDLFYRLSVTTIVIPPIKDRPQDIDLLTNHFIQKFNRTYKKKLQNLSPEVHEFFISYPWPGNVRQLKHVIESAISSIPPDRTEIRMHDMPHYLFDATTTYVGTLQGISVPSLAAPASPASPGTGSCTGFSSYCRRITAGHLTTGGPSAGNTVHDHRREGKAEDTGCSPANWRQYFQSGTPAWYQPAKAFLPYGKNTDPPLMGSRCFLFL